MLPVRNILPCSILAGATGNAHPDFFKNESVVRIVLISNKKLMKNQGNAQRKDLFVERCA